jgi:hypothetical protein
MLPEYSARRVGQQVVRDGVELDRVDLAHAVGQRRLDLVAAGGADDEDPIGCAPERRPQDLPVIGVKRAVVAGVPS